MYAFNFKINLKKYFSSNHNFGYLEQYQQSQNNTNKIRWEVSVQKLSLHWPVYGGGEKHFLNGKLTYFMCGPLY